MAKDKVGGADASGGSDQGPPAWLNGALEQVVKPLQDKFVALEEKLESLSGQVTAKSSPEKADQAAATGGGGGGGVASAADSIVAVVKKSLLDPRMLAESEAKRMRTAWARVSYEEQFSFVAELHIRLETVAQELKDLSELDGSTKVRESLGQVKAVLDVLTLRKKKLLVADMAGNWDAAKHYETVEIASDAADEKRMKKAVQLSQTEAKASVKSAGGKTSKRARDEDGSDGEGTAAVGRRSPWCNQCHSSSHWTGRNCFVDRDRRGSDRGGGGGYGGDRGGYSRDGRR
jgi:hypothetical protein